MFAVLRVIRALFGLVMAYQLIGIIGLPVSMLNAAASSPDSQFNWGEIIGWLIVKVLTLALFGGAFFGMRMAIQKLHAKLHGEPIGALEKKWWAL